MEKAMNNPMARTTLAEARELAAKNRAQRESKETAKEATEKAGQAPAGVDGLHVPAKKSDSIKVSKKRFQDLVDDRVRLRQKNKVLERENTALGDNLLALRKRYGDLSAGFLEISECYFSLLGLLSQITEIRGEADRMDQVYTLVVKGAEAFFQDEAVPFPEVLKKKVDKVTERLEDGMLEEATDYGEDDEEDY